MFSIQVNLNNNHTNLFKLFNNVKNDHITQEQPFTSYYLANELIEILQID